MIEIPFRIGKKTILLRSGDYSGYDLCWPRIQNSVTVYTAEKFFSTLEGALQRVMDLKVKASDVRTLMELRQAIDKARSEIVEEWRLKPDMLG